MKFLKSFDAQHYVKIVINQFIQYLNNKYKVKYDFIAKLIFTIKFHFVKTRKHNVAHWSRAEFDNFTK